MKWLGDWELNCLRMWRSRKELLNIPRFIKLKRRVVGQMKCVKCCRLLASSFWPFQGVSKFWRCTGSGGTTDSGTGSDTTCAALSETIFQVPNLKKGWTFRGLSHSVSVEYVAYIVPGGAHVASKVPKIQVQEILKHVPKIQVEVQAPVRSCSDMKGKRPKPKIKTVQNIQNRKEWLSGLTNSNSVKMVWIRMELCRRRSSKCHKFKSWKRLWKCRKNRLDWAAWQAMMVQPFSRVDRSTFPSQQNPSISASNSRCTRSLSTCPSCRCRRWFATCPRWRLKQQMGFSKYVIFTSYESWKQLGWPLMTTETQNFHGPVRTIWWVQLDLHGFARHLTGRGAGSREDRWGATHPDHRKGGWGAARF